MDFRLKVEEIYHELHEPTRTEDEEG